MEIHEHLPCHEFNSLLVIVLSTVIWSFFYRVFQFVFYTKSPEYNARLITLVHGVITALLGLNQCFLNENPFEHPDWVMTKKQAFILVLSLGYFIHDLIWCAYYKTETGLMIIHHIYTIYALKSRLSKGQAGAQACCCLGCMEVTNPILQLRWFLRYEGLNQTIPYFFVEIIFFIIFFIFRVFVGSYITFLVISEKNDLEFKLSTVVLYIISWLFMVQICKYALQKYVWKNSVDTIVK